MDASAAAGLCWEAEGLPAGLSWYPLPVGQGELSASGSCEG